MTTTDRSTRPSRSAGLLLHPTALPGRFGMGDLGPAAHRFVEQLALARQSWWQILPLGPTGFGNSPYQSLSSFAGHPLLLSPEKLVADGLLRTADLAGAPEGDPRHVDFGRMASWKHSLLRLAAARLRGGSHPHLVTAVAEFRAEHAGWLEDFSLFLALREAHGGRAWTDWDTELAQRNPSALARARRELAEEIDTVVVGQFLFFRQWQALRQHARDRGVHLFGDVPIFVAHDSADVWARPDLFLLDGSGRPRVVAGVPPDYFSATGQRWGNPLYRWENHAADGFAWWTARLRASLELVDLVRIDHFIGFVRYWEIPAHEPTAIHGHWCEAPGAELLTALRRALGGLPLVAEDLGAVTPEVDALRERFGLPGMKVLQFAFGGGSDNRFLPHHHAPDFVAYPGTHDNDTTAGWFAAAPAAVRDHVVRYLGGVPADVTAALLRLGLASVARTFITPVPDLLGLGSEARFNEPGRPTGNWSWRLLEHELGEEVLSAWGEQTETYGRAAGSRRQAV